MWMQFPQRPEGGIRYPGAGVGGSGEPSAVGAGNESLVFTKPI